MARLFAAETHTHWSACIALCVIYYCYYYIIILLLYYYYYYYY